MPLKPWIVLLFCCAAFFSGCNEQPSKTDPPITSQSTSHTTSSSDSGTVRPQVPAADSLTWNGCVGANSIFRWPGNSAPSGSEVPPGWEHGLEDFTSYQLVILQCERVSIGPFERGPVFGMLESHNNAVFPGECLEFEEGIDAMDVLVAVWIDDVELAGYLEREYGMPVHVANFSYSLDQGPAGEERHWRWSTEGAAESELLMPYQPTSPAGSDFVLRYAWHNETSVSVMDNHHSYSIESDDASGVSHGFMRDPMLFAKSGVEAYVGRASAWVSGDARAPIYQFGDLECKEPL